MYVCVFVCRDRHLEYLQHTLNILHYGDISIIREMIGSQYIRQLKDIGRNLTRIFSLICKDVNII